MNPLVYFCFPTNKPPSSDEINHLSRSQNLSLSDPRVDPICITQLNTVAGVFNVG